MSNRRHSMRTTTRRGAQIDRALAHRHNRMIAWHQLSGQTRLLSRISARSQELLHKHTAIKIIRAAPLFGIKAARFRLVACLLLTFLVATGILIFRHDSEQPLPSSTIGDQDRIVFVFAGQPVTASMFHTAEFQRVQTLLNRGKYVTTAQDHQHVTDYAFASIADNIETEKAMRLYGTEGANDLVTKLFPLQQVSSQDAHRFYETHPSLFARPVPSIHVREIVVNNRQLADNLLTRLHAGASFTDLATQYSVDPTIYRQAGGDLGWMAEGAMPPDWNDVVYTLHKGETSGVFKVSNTLYCIVQVIDGPIYDTVPFDAVTPSVAVIAAQYAQQQQFMAWLTERILKEPIEVRDPAFTGAVRTALADLAAHPSQTFD